MCLLTIVPYTCNGSLLHCLSTLMLCLRYTVAMWWCVGAIDFNRCIGWPDRGRARAGCTMIPCPCGDGYGDGIPWAS